MTNRRKNQAQATHTQAGRRKLAPALTVVPRSALSAVGRVAPGVRPDLLRYVDFHPALSILIGVAIIALVGVIYLGQVTAVTNANYTLQALQDEHTTLLREKQDLQLQIGRAQSLPNIEDKARHALGMVPIEDRYEYLPVAPGPIQKLDTAKEPGDQTPTPNP